MANKDEIRYTIKVDADSGTAAIRDLKGQIVATKVPLTKLRNEFGNLAKTVNATDFKKFNNELKNSSQQMQSMGTAMKGASAASGSASASVLEMGRAISDSNYGMQGMANNLSQLSSNFIYTTKAAGGLGKGLKALGSAMLGPLGVIVLVQTVIAVFERMAMEANNLEDKLKDLNDTGITESVVKLMLLKDALNDTTLSLKDKNGVIRTAREEYEDLNIAIDDNNVATAESVIAIDAEIDALMRSAKAKAINKLASELMVEQIKAETSDLEDNISWYEKGWLYFNNSRENARVKVEEQAKENRKEDVDEFQDSIDKLVDKLKENADPSDPTSGILLQWLYGKKKDRGNSRNRADRIFKAGILDLEKFILNKNRDFQLASEENEVKQLKIKQKFAQEDLKLTVKTFKEKQQLRFDQWTEAEAKRKNMSVEEYKTTKKFAEEESKLKKSFLDADNNYKRAADSLNLLQTEETENQRLEIIRKYGELISKAKVNRAKSENSKLQSLTGGTKAGSLGSPMSSVGAEGIDTQIAAQRAVNDAQLAEYNRSEEERRTALLNAGMSAMEVEGIIFEERMVFQDTLATREIDLERQKVDAKMAINQEYISWLGGLGGIMSDLAGESEALATVALVLEKGAAIADIIVKTQSANAKVTLAATEEASGYSATAGLYSANPAAAAGYIAMAKAATIRGKTRVLKNNIGSGISIAKIAATTLQSKSAGGGASGGGGGESGGGRTFDFNLVGSTGQNQLAQGIAGQFNEPVQAYVVSSQITSQQQLDNQISSSATIGD